MFIDDMTDPAPVVTPGAADDRPVSHYSLKHRAIAWISRNLFDQYVYEVRHGLLKGLRRKGGLGFLPAFVSGSVETPETRFWRDLNLSGKVVYDVGAFEGLLTCYFASRAKHVVCFEPSQRTHKRLLENLRLNQFANFTPCQVGLGAQPDKVTLVWDPAMPGGASAESALQDQMRHQQNAGSLRQETIQISTLDAECVSCGLPPDFIKVDVEGLELQVLAGAAETLRKYAPELFLEMHGETMNAKRRKVAAIVDFLLEHDYGNIVHIESGESIDRSNSAKAAEGHLYCRAS